MYYLQMAATEALKLDRTEIDGRAMYVSKCVDKGEKRGQFKVNIQTLNRWFMLDLVLDLTINRLINSYDLMILSMLVLLIS